MPPKRCSYTASFKLAVLRHSKEHGKHAAERKYGVCTKMIRRWADQEEDLESMPRAKKANRKGQCLYPDMEKALTSWIVDMRQQGFAVSREFVRYKALELSKHAPSGFDRLPSHHWCDLFLRRQLLCLRARTKVIFLFESFKLFLTFSDLWFVWLWLTVC